MCLYNRVIIIHEQLLIYSKTYTHRLHICLLWLLLMSADILSDVLRSLRATGTVYFCDQLVAPWTKDYPGESMASFHHVRRGGCWFTSEGVEEYLGPGDMVFIEPRRAHQLADKTIRDSENNAQSTTLLLCGYCEFDESLAVPLSSLFPRISIIRDEQLQEHAWLRTLLDTLSSEHMSNRPGTAMVVNKLTEVLLVELIRINFGHGTNRPLLRALSDKQIGHALQLLHNRPEKAWSLETLSTDVGMSRASFAKRFKSLVELTMFDYLTQLRLQRACELLTNTSQSLYEIANSVGYESDLSFTRTFKKKLGVTPTHYRKQSLEL